MPVRVRVIFDQERGRPSEIHEMSGIPNPSSIHTLNVKGVRYDVHDIVEFVPATDVDAEIKVSKDR